MIKKLKKCFESLYQYIYHRSYLPRLDLEDWKVRRLQIVDHFPVEISILFALSTYVQLPCTVSEDQHDDLNTLHHSLTLRESFKKNSTPSFILYTTLPLRTPCTYPIELLDIECALCHVTGVQFDKRICPYKSAILDFSQKLPFAFAQNVLGRANFALINPPFCVDNFLTDTRQEPAFYVYYFYDLPPLYPTLPHPHVTTLTVP